MTRNQSVHISRCFDSLEDSQTNLLSYSTSPVENQDTEDAQHPGAYQREKEETSINSSQTDVTLNDTEKLPPRRTHRPWSALRERWRNLKLATPSKKANIPSDGDEWTKGVKFAMRWTALVLFVNIVLAIIAIAMGYSGSSASNDRSTVSTAIYDGKCSVSGGWASGLHVLINILSTGLLAASNYAMQTLSAPSREDVDAAHSKGKWLDIGIFSYRNILAMDNRRKLIWLVLLLTSVPIHLMYNSVVFSSMATNLYGLVLIPDDLGRDEMISNGNNYTAEGIRKTVGYSAQDLQAEIFNGTLKNLTLEECVDAYAVEYNTHRTTVVLVADREHFNNYSSLQAYYGMSSQDYFGYNSYRYSWMCTQERPVSCTKEDVMDLVNRGKWSVWAEYWAYRDWTFHDPSHNGMNRSFSCDYNLVEHLFDKNNTPLRTDLGTLCNYITTYNPNEERLGQYLKSASHWENSTWASQVSFQWQNYTDSVTSFDDPLYSPALEVSVSHCMSKESEEKCQLLFSLPICLVIILCNMIKLVGICLAANTKRKSIFLTVGDAISSFLSSPDPSTKHLCFQEAPEWDDKEEVLRKESYVTRPFGLSSPREHGHHSTPLKRFISMSSLYASGDADRGSKPRNLSCPRRWYQAVSLRCWMLLLFIIISSYITATVLFHIGSGQRYPYQVTLQTSWETGFGKPSSVAMIGQAAQSVMEVVLLSNLPQLVLSVLYFLSNGILINMVVAAEYNDYAIHRNPLRVSWPKGQQRSTRYLSLPYRYRVPFVIFSVGLHWLMSQSLFFTQVRLFDIDGELVERWSTTRCGYSLVAILTTLIVGAIATLTLVGLGLRKYKSNMPLPIYSSVEISAACHPPPDDQDAALKPVMWGVPIDGAYGGNTVDARSGYFTFTSQEVLT
ncbi:uncharacterized protein KD926_011617 [Aspergillus affinis]|uniref:uncharacterized protein n=1 Tax=Aspergillus affinis TaxID=1070780 RepID=UPI0022FE20AD|nr:uncharacterized protein KD926_011617 [Aspergillus affinis]KAI9044647.1 hypothetical protein KD926_011617 [Aspergillus affinis]